ncbi:MAG: gliding motility-associated C-terminal domain-containing protein [Saprospiraceae bacterium]
MMKILTSILLVFTYLTALSQPINDDCSGLIDFGEAPVCPIPDTFNNVGATTSMVFSNPNDNIPSCYTNGVINRDVWFAFSVPASGDIVDFTILLTGVNGPNGSIVQPQITVYRGECLLDEMEEFSCAQAALGESFLEMDLLSLTPGLVYYLRVSNWSASASPNSGDFVLCIKELDPVYTMGTDLSSESCGGTLFDSGGPSGDYSSNENYTFTICPQQNHQCISLEMVAFSMEAGFDNLSIYEGMNTAGQQITNFTAAGNNVLLQTPSNCITLLFNSDASVNDTGFELTWQCFDAPCSIPPPSTCDNPTVVPSLPYAANDLTTCSMVNNYSNSPCGDDDFLSSDDVVFTYTSPGDECISISISGSNDGTGVAIFDDCPDVATTCLSQAGGNLGAADPAIGSVYLELPGTYYIVVDNANFCTDFNISIQQATCPVVFPSAAYCEDALSLNGCQGEGGLPAIVSVGPGQGDPDAIITGVNNGCWGGFPTNFTWFFFQAQSDGEFGFVMQATDPAEASDVDFQVWGPVGSAEELCDFTLIHQPIRSSYAAGPDPTGLANIHPITGVAVTDTCETAAGDDFVSAIPVMTGEWYIVLINDWEGNITSGAVSIDFGGTTAGVLDAMPLNFSVSADTMVCPGQTVQLMASGGEVYDWLPDTGLTCNHCPDPIATVTEPMVYQVAIHTICVTDTLQVEVGLLTVDAGPDLTVCLGEDIQIAAGSNFDNIIWEWTGQTSFLSCTDCADPVVTANAAGDYEFIATVTGPTCSYSDTMKLTVLPNQAPVYQISDDLQICQGEGVSLGGDATVGVSYSWMSLPAGFTSIDSNPMDTPIVNTVYYLQLNNGECPLPSNDSVSVVVSARPIIDVVPDTIKLCLGESAVLGTTLAESGVVYTWSPTTGLNNEHLANAVATPDQTTQYVLTAERNGCQTLDTVNVQVTIIDVDIATLDTGICKGASLPLVATALPAGVDIIWSPNDGSLNDTIGASVVATPATFTTYIATVTVPGCTIKDTITVEVDSLPNDLAIMPLDTNICQGELVYLTSTTYEPFLFGDITFQWLPASGQLTPDSLFNMVVQPGDTTEYFRIATNGFCTDTSYATVNVMPIDSIYIVPSDTAICEGNSVDLQIFGSSALTDIAWMPSQGLSCPDCTETTAAPLASTTYLVTAKSNDCPVSASATVNVLPGPTLDLPDNTTICSDSSILLNLSSDNSTIYIWNASDGSFSNDTIKQPIVSPQQTTTYTVRALRNGCGEVVDSVTIFVPADFVLSIEPVGIICPGESVTLLADADGAANPMFTWTDGVNQLGTEPTLNVGPLAATTQFFVTVEDGGCHEHTDSIMVEVSPIYTLTLTDTVYVQAGEAVTLTPTVDPPGPNYQYFWVKDSLLVGNGPSFSDTFCDSQHFDLTVSDENGCSQSDDVWVIVQDGISIIEVVYLNKTEPGDTVFEGHEVVLVAHTLPETIPGATYNWYFNNVLFSTTTDTVSAAFNAPEVDEDTDFPFRVEITNPSGCVLEDSSLLRVYDNPVEMPNAFSPNGDNLNDVFLPISKKPITVLEFKVWNRWGQLVYEMENGSDGWSGKQKEGEAPSDVYVYYLIYEITGGNTGAHKPLKGDVTLLR